MKNMLLLFSVLLLSLSSHAQQTRGRSIPSYTTPLGTVFHKGDTLHFGLGQREDGTFRYINIAPNLLAAQGLSLPRSYANLKAVVLEVKETGYAANSRGVAVIKAGVYNAVVELASAEQAGELATPNNKKATPTRAGVADELLKLKALLDAGALTPAEFDAQKSKLLTR